MANPFDQFDAAPSRNPFDQFDAASGTAPTVTPAAPPTLTQTIMRDAAPVAESAKSAIASIPRLVDRGVRGLAKGIVSIGTLPVEAGAMSNQLTEWLAGKAGVPPAVVNAAQSVNPFAALGRLQPALGKKAVEGYLDTANEATAGALGVNAPRRQGETMPERMVERGFEEVGAAAVPVAAAINKAKIGVEAARKLPLLARMFVEPAAVDASKFAGKEMAMAAMAGTGAGIGNEITHAAGYKEGDVGHAVGDIGGALAGAGALGLANIAGRPMADIINAIFRRDKFSNNVVKNEVVDRIANNAASLPRREGEPINTDPLADAIMRPTGVQDAIPGFRESVADRTGDPGLAALEYGRQSGPGAGEYVAQRSANTQAVDDAMRASEPTGTTGALRAELALERDRRLSDANVQAGNASDNARDLIEAITPGSTPQARGATVRIAVDDALSGFIADAEAASRAATAQAEQARQALRPTSDPAVRGNTVRSTLEQRRDAARERTASAYDEANVSDNLVNPEPLTEALDGATRGLTTTERAMVPRGLVDRVAALGRRAVDDAGTEIPPDPVRLKEATDLASELRRRQRAALADPNAEHGGRNVARVLGQQAETVEAFVARNLSDEEAAAVQVARGAKFDEAEGFTRRGDDIASVLARNEGGRPRMRDERVAGTFVNPATNEPLERLLTHADTPQVRAAIEDEILSRLPRNPDAAQVDRFVQDFEIPLRQFPGLRERISAAAGSQRQAESAVEAITARRNEFSGDSRALADTTARRADGTPALLDEQVAGRFVNQTGNRDLDALLSRADTPEVRKAIEDEIVSRGANSLDDAERVRAFVGSYDQPLQRFPGLRERLLNAAGARATERGARENEQRLTRELGTPERPGTSTVGQYLRYGDERAQDALKGVIASKNPGQAADELLRFVNDDPAAVEGGRKVFWDLMQSRARSAGETTKVVDGVQPWMPRRLQAFLDDPAVSAVAERLYRDQPEHLANIRKIADALQQVDLRTRAKAANTSGTAQSISNVLTPETLQSRFYAYKRGQTSLGFMLTALGSVAARRLTRSAQAEAIERLTDKALLDPKFAADLLKENNPANRAAMNRTAKTYLGNEVATILSAANGEEDEDPVKKAAMRK